jgi:hypothetical protein
VSITRAIFIAFCVSGLAVTAALAGDGTVRRSSDPFPGTYIAFLDPKLPGSPRDYGLQLTNSHGGSVEHIYSTVFKGFSFKGNEIAARAISHDPHVSYVTEATKMYLTGSGTQQPTPSWGTRPDQ